MSGSGSAFCPPKPLSLATHRNQRLVFYSEENPQEPAVVETPVGSPKSEGTSYPIPLPSPILLSASMGLAIISTGSIFELSGGNPQFGFAATCATAAVGVPLCFFLFYAAIKKGTAETEEDDKKFLGEK